jgi:uncharacterized phage protein gp47/JayE
VLLPSRSDLFNIGTDEVLARSLARPPGQRIAREAVFIEGTDINLILGSASAMGDEIMRQLAQHCAALILDSSEGDDLSRLALDRTCNVVARKGSIPSVVTLAFGRTNALAPGFSLPVGTKFRTIRGTEFALTQILTYPAGSTAIRFASAVAVVSGSQGNVQPGTITQFVQQPPDPTLVVTNNQPAAGGSDIELDAPLRERVRLFFTAARRGTKAAIKFGALTVAGVEHAQVVEVLDPATQRPVGIVQVFIADRAGTANSLLATAVRDALVEYRAAGIVVDVFAASVIYVAVTLRLRFDAGVDVDAAWAEIQFLLVSEINTLAPGEALEVSLLYEIARRVPGVIVLDDALITPNADVEPLEFQSIRTTPELVTRA